MLRPEAPTMQVLSTNFGDTSACKQQQVHCSMIGHTPETVSEFALPMVSQNGLSEAYGSVSHTSYSYRI